MPLLRPYLFNRTKSDSKESPEGLPVLEPFARRESLALGSNISSTGFSGMYDTLAGSATSQIML